MHKILPVLALTLFFFAFSTAPVRAQVEDPILTLPEGQVILSISATERREVEQDLLVASLSYNATDRAPQIVQNEINTVMTRALEAAKEVEAVKVSTGAYQVYQFSDPRTRETKWRGNQAITLKSTDADKLLELVATLQKMNLTMNGLNYTLDPAKAAEIQDDLMEAALAKLTARAERAAAALGKADAELREVNVQSEGLPYPTQHYGRTMMMESASVDMAAPVAAAGETTITLTVSARALLKP